MGPKRRKRSKVWLHFTEKENNWATCNTCKVDISSKGGNTTNMQKHLHTKHAITLGGRRDSDPLRKERQPEPVSSDSASTPSTATLASVQAFREFINERLTAAAAEIFTVFEQTIIQYEEVIGRQHRLLEINRKPQINLQTAELQEHHDCREEQLFNWEPNYSLEQEQPEPPQIKDEPEHLQVKEEPEPTQIKEHQEVGTSPNGERLTLKFESDSFKVPSIEEQSLLSEREEVSDTEQFLSRDSEVYRLKRCPDSESNINAEQKETSIFHSDRVDDIPVSENQVECKKLLGEETCGGNVRKKRKLHQNLETLTDKKKISCELCGKGFSRPDSLLDHMRTHTGEKPYSLPDPRRSQPGYDRLLPVASVTEEKMLSAISALSCQVARLEHKLDQSQAASEARDQRLQERMAAMEAKLNSFFDGEEIKRKRRAHGPKITEMVHRIHNSEDNIIRYEAEQGLGSPRNEAVTTYLVQMMAARPDVETVETDCLLSACKTYYETLRRNFQAEAMKSSLVKKENAGCKGDYLLQMKRS